MVSDATQQNIWQQYPRQDQSKDEVAMPEQAEEQFWVKYEALIEDAKTQELKTQVATVNSLPNKIDINEYLHLPWVRLMLPYWNELPLVVRYQTDNETASILGVQIVLTLFLALVGTGAAFYSLIIITMMAIFAIMFIWMLSIDTGGAKPVTHHIFEFEPHYIAYEKKTLYNGHTPRAVNLHIQVPYESINQVTLGEHGLTILGDPFSPWLDNYNGPYSELTINRDQVHFTKVSEFLQEVVRTNRDKKRI